MAAVGIRCGMEPPRDRMSSRGLNASFSFGSQSAYVVKAANRPKAGVGRGPRSGCTPAPDWLAYSGCAACAVIS